MTYIGVSPSNGVRRVHTYTASGSQTTFTGASSEGITLSYTDANFMDVYQNGVLLAPADYTATSGTSVVLAEGAAASDIVTITVYDAFSVADTVSKSAGGTFDGNVAMAGTLNVASDVTFDSAGAILFDQSDKALEFNSSLYKIKLVDNSIISFGTSGDAYVQHSGSNLQFINSTGGVQITNTADDNDVDIRSDDGSGGTALYFKADGSTGEAKLFHYGSEALKTTAYGADVTGTIDADSATISGPLTADSSTLGTISLSMIGGQATIQKDGALNIRGNWIRLQKPNSTTDMIIAKPDGEAELYHNGSQKFETTSTGVSVSSSADATMSITAGSTSDDSKIDFVHGSTTDGGITYDHNGSYASEEMKFRTGNNTPNMTLNGSGTLTVANGLTLTDGNLVVASGHGIDFSATQNAPQNSPTTNSELFDDYEEGQWTPSVDGGGTTYGNRIGWYTKIGEIVQVFFNVSVNSFGGSVRYLMGGLPYTSKNTTASGSGLVTYFSNIHTNATVLTARIDANNSSIYFSGMTTSGHSQTINHNVFKDQTAIFGSVIYRAT